jgi:hypothetical protein
VSELHKPHVDFAWEMSIHLTLEDCGILNHQDRALGVLASLQTPRKKNGEWGEGVRSYRILDEKPERWYDTEDELYDALWEKRPLLMQKAAREQE